MTVEPRSLGELARDADAIFVGRLAEQVLGRAPGVGILTQHRFVEVTWLKGGTVGGEFVLQTCGGQVEDQVFKVGGAPDLAAGGRYILFLEDHLDTCWPIAGGWQGVFQVVDAPDGGTAIADGAGRVMARLSNGVVEPRPYFARLPPPEYHQIVSPAQGRPLSIEQFTRRVAALAADDPGRPVRTTEFGRFAGFALEDAKGR